MCDSTQKLNETESESFYDTDTNTFCIPNVFDTESDTFFENQFVYAESETMQKMEKFQNRNVTFCS